MFMYVELYPQMEKWMENDGKQQPQLNSKVNSTFSFLSNYI